MLFHTWIFAAFFLVVWPVHLAVKNKPGGYVWLLLASYVFYGWWNPLYLLLIAYSTSVDFTAVTLMAKFPPPAAAENLPRRQHRQQSGASGRVQIRRIDNG